MPSASRELTLAALVPLLIVTFLTTYLFSSANIALPEIATDLRTSGGEQTLILAAYAATFAGALMLWGRFGDNVGRRRLLAFGLVAVIVTNIGAAFAQGPIMLIALRGLQGIATAAAAPQVLATIQASATGARRVTAISAFGAVGGAGTAAGQILAGALIAWNPLELGWRAVYLFAAVIATVALVLLPIVPATRSAAHARLDVLGAALLGSTLVLLLIGLSLGPSTGWWPLPAIMLAGAALGGLGFAIWQARAQRRSDDDPARIRPLLPPRVLRVRSVRLGLALAFLMFANYGAFMYEYALVSEHDQGMSPLASGALLVPFALAFTVVSLSIARIERRLGRFTMVWGGLIQIVGMTGVAASQLITDGTWWAIAVGTLTVLMSVGQGMMFAPLLQTMMAGIPDDVAGLTGGLVTTAQQAALAIGAAVFGGVLLTLSGSLGLTGAFGVVMTVQILLLAAFVLIAFRLARPRGSARNTRTQLVEDDCSGLVHKPGTPLTGPQRQQVGSIEL